MPASPPSSRPTERSEGEPGPIGPGIVERGPVQKMAHVSVAAITCNPAALLNGSRVCPRCARLPGMTTEREMLPGVRRVRVITISRTRIPAALLNGSRVCPRKLGCPG